ncbi:thermolabile hemolysin precursor [mine drainage metagenome]|uniref:Thermolabile hemolysin n=1 Tax=mine drainage metagenome TaxID=410659 RepID=A0A1J5QYM9_9ZZZZ
MRQVARRSIGVLGTVLLALTMNGCGGGSEPPLASDQLVSVPEADSLLSPVGPLTAAQVYALDPTAVAQAFHASPDPGAAEELAVLENAHAAVPRLEAASSTQAYTYLYCYATGWLSEGGQRLPLGRGPGDNFYLSGWAKLDGLSGAGLDVKLPVVVPSTSPLEPVNRHLVYYTSLYTPEQLSALCTRSMLVKAQRLQAREYPGSTGTLEIDDVVARGRNNSLADDHPLLPLAGTVGDGRIHTLVSLGDSLSDTDATSNMLLHILPNRSTWFAGHFTNGWVWSEYAAQDLGVIAYNEAWGAAGASSQSILRVFPGANWIAKQGVGYYFPSPAQQVGLYDKRVMQLAPRPPDETLYTLLIGGNDFVNYNEPVATVLKGVNTALRQLITVEGARNIVVLNLPDITSAPVFLAGKASIRTTVKARLDAYDAQLPDLLDALRSAYPQVDLTLFDTRAVFDDILHDPKSGGFVNAAQSCLIDPSESYSMTEKMRVGCNGYNYVFWDSLHPTTAVHAIIGSRFAAFVRMHYAF